MTGTPDQIEWAERIKHQVNAEFERVAKALEGAAGRQPERARLDTNAVLAVLEQKRLEVMAVDQAGYFIRDWQELRDQVRQMIARDPTFQAIRKRREARDRCKDASTSFSGPEAGQPEAGRNDTNYCEIHSKGT